MDRELLLSAIGAALRGEDGAVERLEGLCREIEDGLNPESLVLHANLRIEVHGPDGALRQRGEHHNLICTVGKNLILASGGTAEYPKQFSYVAVGTGTNAAAIGDTALQTELTRVAGAVSNPSANTLQIVGTFAAGVATGAITESGLLDAAAAGNILARQVFAAYNKGAGDSLTVTWSIT